MKLWICIADRREHASNALPLPVSRRWSLLASPFSQAFSEYWKTTDTGWCITRYACLLPQLSPGTHSSLTTEGGLRLSRPMGAWFYIRTQVCLEQFFGSNTTEVVLLSAWHSFMGDICCICRDIRCEEISSIVEMTSKCQPTNLGHRHGRHSIDRLWFPDSVSY